MYTINKDQKTYKTENHLKLIENEQTSLNTLYEST